MNKGERTKKFIIEQSSLFNKMAIDPLLLLKI
jgi:hypothetical protein